MSDPIVVGQTVSFVNNAASVVVPLPPGTLAGHLLVLATGHGWVPTLPSGWSSKDAQNGTNVNGLVCTKIATAGDITAGSVTVDYSDNYYGDVILVTVDLAGPVKEVKMSRSGGGSSSVSVSTTTSANVGDLALYFGFNRGTSSTTSFNRGTFLDSRNGDSEFSAGVAKETLASAGTVTVQVSHSNAGIGYYDGIVLIEPLVSGMAPVNVGSSSRVYKKGPQSAAVVTGGGQAHIGTFTAGSFTLSSDIEVTGCTIYTTPFDGGIPVGTRIGVSTNLAGLTTIPWVASGLSTSDPGQGSLPVTVQFDEPVVLQAGVIYCITGDCDVLVANGTTTTGEVATNRNWLSGHPFVADTGAYRMPFQLFGFVQPREVTGLSPVNVNSSNRARSIVTSLAPVNVGSSNLAYDPNGPATGMAPVNVGSSSRIHATALAPVNVESSSRVRARVTGMAPVNVETSSVLERRVKGSSPVISGSSSLSYRIVDFEENLDEDGTIQIPIELSGFMDPEFPPPTPPVNFDGLSDPTVAPTLAKSTTATGYLEPGVYRYSYAAWKGSQAQATAPAPTSDITLTTENTVTLTFPTVPGADGYLIYREEL